MAGHRFFISSHAIRGATITIDDPKELHHVRDVLRLRVNDPVTCCDGAGSEYVGRIAKTTSRRYLIQIDQTHHTTQATLTLWLAQGLPKGDRFDWVVQKATELGVARVSPLLTRHTVVRLTEEQGRKRLVRWRRIAQEAAKQCGRASLPTIDPPQPLDTTWLSTIERVPLILMPTLAVTAIPLREVLKSRADVIHAAVLIGPEGDFSPEEVALAETYGARPVSLGRSVLRSETAALAVLAILRYLLGA